MALTLEDGWKRPDGTRGSWRCERDLTCFDCSFISFAWHGDIFAGQVNLSALKDLEEDLAQFESDAVTSDSLFLGELSKLKEISCETEPTFWRLVESIFASYILSWCCFR